VPNFQFVRETKDKLAAAGLSECVSYSFTNMKDVADAKLEGLAAPVPLRNPLTEDHTHMRASLVPGMLKIVSMNMRRGNKNLSLFELGKVFISGDEPSEKLSLVIALTGELWTTPARSMQDIRLAQYYQVKGVAEDFLARMSDSKPVFAEATLPLFHPARSASIMLAGEKIGELGEVHPQICRAFDIRAGLSLAEIDVEKLREVAGRQITYKKISRFPAMSRDISIIVDEPVKAASIEDIVNAHGGEILRSVDIVDVFRGEIIGAGKKSVTFALEFRHDERTLGDEEVNAVMTPMLEDIKTKLGGMLRES